MGTALIVLSVSSLVGLVSFTAGWLFGRTHASEEMLALTDQVQHLAELADERRERIDAIQARMEEEAPAMEKSSIIERIFRSS